MASSAIGSEYRGGSRRNAGGAMRMLDRQFERLMAQYGDDEIGELEQVCI